MKFILIVFAVILCSCNWAKEKTKAAVNKTGEAVAKTGSEFAQGLSKGVEKTFQNVIVLTDKLKQQGLQTGKITIRGTDSTTDNILSAYLIFEDTFDQDITIKVIDEDGKEYGRVTQNIKGSKNEAKYVDFIFDKRTNIDSKGKLFFQ